MNRDFIVRHWYADVYEQFENQTYDTEFLLNVLHEHVGEGLNILEVACGGGRMTVPIGRAGHRVTGFDVDVHRLMRCYRLSKGLPNVRCHSMNMEESDWGEGYDVVLLAANLLINIVSEKDYKQAQIDMIRRAAKAVRPGGYLYMDFDLHFDPAKVFNRLGEHSYFEGADDMGTSGRTVSYGGAYDPVTQMYAAVGHMDLTTSNGEKLVVNDHRYKHIPTQAQVYAWLRDAGLTIGRTYKNYTDEPLPEPIDEETFRATILAQK